MEHTGHYEEALKTERARLVVELTDLAVHNPETDDWEVKTEGTIDEADESLLADEAEQADADSSMLAELENQYRHIQIALRKIEAGTYGICEICGDQIDEERLYANPAARTCRVHMHEESQLPL